TKADFNPATAERVKRVSDGGIGQMIAQHLCIGGGHFGDEGLVIGNVQHILGNESIVARGAIQECQRDGGGEKFAIGRIGNPDESISQPDKFFRFGAFVSACLAGFDVVHTGLSSSLEWGRRAFPGTMTRTATTWVHYRSWS